MRAPRADGAKIEIHLHHEGAAPPEFIRRLAAEKKVDLSKIFDETGGYVFTSFTEFLRTYEAACTVLQTPQDFYHLTRAILEESASHGVIYTETFLAPDFCGNSDVAAWRDYLAAIEEAANHAHQEHGIVMRGIATCVRHMGPEHAKKSGLCAAETAGDFLTGFGMGGDESVGHQGDFAYAFDMAREAGLRLTTHAGEWGGPQSMREAIHDLNVERIGHGVQCIKDPALIEEIKARQITLEVCPGSNVTLEVDVAPSWAEHPIKALFDQSVRVTVSTDDPPFFHTNLTREYDMLADTFGWDAAEFCVLNENAVDAAFCDAETKKTLREKVRKSWINT
jgi:adenosine deaminase